MDDLMPSVPTVEIAKETQRQLTELGSLAGFHIRKWISNRPEVLEDIPEETSFQLRRRWESCGLRNATPSHLATN